jgi:hypothetical protein
LTNNEIKDLQEIATKLGEKYVKQYTKNKKRCRFTKEDNMILNNSKHVFLTEEEIQNFDNIKKKNYYKEISNKLYNHKDNILFDNKNYEKPCMLFRSNSDTERGRISVFRKDVQPHRLSYALFNNIFIEDIPTINDNEEKLEVCHGHDCNFHCIEPTHLSLKTKPENNYDDKIRDGTLPKGEKHHNSKITDEIAKQIFESKGTNTAVERAKLFGTTEDIVRHIDYGHTWTHVTGIDTTDLRKQNRERYKKNQEQEITEELHNEILIHLEQNTIRDENGCHIYNKSDARGYGFFVFKGIQREAHIISYELHNNDKKGDMTICHKCDVKLCCNPVHLYKGTNRDNALDIVENGSKAVKLTKEQVKEIKELLKSEELFNYEIAEKFGVNDATISNIKTEKTWKHVSI